METISLKMLTDNRMAL